MINLYEYSFGDIIKKLSIIYLKEGDKSVENNTNWNVFTANWSGEFCSVLKCYIIDLPSNDEKNDKPTYDDFISKNNLEMIISGELLCDIICSALYQKDTASIDEIIGAINYYYSTDCFIEYDTNNDIWLSET